MDARDRSGNELVFNYPEHEKSTIKNYLDIMHSIKVKLDLIDVLQLIKFVKYEGKTGNLLGKLCDELAKSDMQAAQKLLICLACDRFDNFEGVMAKVFLTCSCRVSDIFSVFLQT